MTRIMADNEDNNTNINHNVETSRHATLRLQRNTTLMNHEMVNLDEPLTSMRVNSTVENRNPNLTHLDHVQVPTKELADMKTSLEKVTKELRDLKTWKVKEPKERYS